jgi:hypothetical protein
MSLLSDILVQRLIWAAHQPPPLLFWLVDAPSLFCQVESAAALHELAFVLDIQQQQRCTRGHDHGDDSGAASSDPPPASNYARRLADQIADKERRPQIFDTFALAPGSIVGVVAYYVGAVLTLLYEDIKDLFIREL